MALGAGALAPSLAALAQQLGKTPRVGFIYFGSRHSAVESGRYDAFIQGMRDLGYIKVKIWCSRCASPTAILNGPRHWRPS